MQIIPVSPEVEVTATAPPSRRSKPRLPVRDVVDHVMARRIGLRIDFGTPATIRRPFVLLVAEALEGSLLPGAWVGLWRSQSCPKLRQVFAGIWADVVWRKFAVRHCQWGHVHPVEWPCVARQRPL